MSEIKQVQVSNLKSGRYVIFDGIACIIKSIDTSKTGKHGHSKSRIEAVSLIDNKKIVKIMPGSDKIDTPIIEKKVAQILSINNDIANVMDLESYETFDLKIPNELKSEVKEGSQIIYWIILKDKVMRQVK